MKNVVLGFALLMGLSASAQTSQPHAPEGILVRIDAKTGEKVVVDATLDTQNPSVERMKEVADTLIANNEAIAVKEVTEGSELDDDSSTESWYWYWNYNTYNYYYNYYGWNYTYFPTYWWNYGNYSYYYYRWW